MTRDQFAHIIRAAAEISGRRDIIVFGSQAILGSISETRLPFIAVRSMEADLVLYGTPGGEKVEALMGLDSQFYKSFGVYADTVSQNTSTPPRGWRRRLVPFETAATQPGRALCLDRHDLAVSKLMAGRPKDFAFVSALCEAGLLSLPTMSDRLRYVDGVTKAQLDRARAYMESCKPRSG